MSRWIWWLQAIVQTILQAQMRQTQPRLSRMVLHRWCWSRPLTTWPWRCHLMDRLNHSSMVISFCNRKTNGLGGDQSVGIASSILTRTLVPMICWSWWRLGMRTASLLCRWPIREGKPMTASRFYDKSEKPRHNSMLGFQVMVGATVDLYCEDYWKKPKKDTWDDDR